MKAFKKINFRSVLETLAIREMKRILGGGYNGSLACYCEAFDNGTIYVSYISRNIKYTLFFKTHTV